MADDVVERKRGFYVDEASGIRYWNGRSWVQMVVVDGFWHTHQCVAGTALERQWKTAWPDHCGTCNGEGVKVYYENQSPLGSGLQWLERLTEPCDDCTGSDSPHCPRCGKPAPAAWDDGDEVPCPECGWQWGENPDDSCPTTECGCYWYTDLEGWSDAVAQWAVLRPEIAERVAERQREWREKQVDAARSLRAALLGEEAVEHE